MGGGQFGLVAAGQVEGDVFKPWREGLEDFVSAVCHGDPLGGCGLNAGRRSHEAHADIVEPHGVEGIFGVGDAGEFFEGDWIGGGDARGEAGLGGPVPDVESEGFGASPDVELG